MIIREKNPPICYYCFSTGMGIQTVYEQFVNPDLPTGYDTMITIFSIFSGIQLMAIGMVGEYLGRTFLSLNKKPQFTIRSELTNKKV